MAGGQIHLSSLKQRSILQKDIGAMPREEELHE